jgi:hypothetical protein
MMDLCNKKGVKEVLRIIPDTHKDIGFTLLSHLHYGPEVEVTTYDNSRRSSAWDFNLTFATGYRKFGVLVSAQDSSGQLAGYSTSSTHRAPLCSHCPTGLAPSA